MKLLAVAVVLVVFLLWFGAIGEMAANVLGLARSGLVVLVAVYLIARTFGWAT
jgi:hypothetical protein